MIKNEFKIQSLGMFLAAGIWGTWVIILKGITLPGFFVTAITSLTGSLVLFIIILISGQWPDFVQTIKAKSLWRLIITVAFLAALQNALFMASFKLAIADGGSVLIPIIRSLVGVIIPFAVLFFRKGEKFSLQFLFYGALATVGALSIFTWGGLNIGEQISYFGLFLAFCSVVALAVQYIFLRRLAVEMAKEGRSSLPVITFQSFLSFLFLVPLLAGYLLINTEIISFGLIRQLLYIGFFGITHVALAFIFMFKALKYLNAQQSQIIGYLEPLVSVTLSILFLKELINLGYFVGASLILVAAMAASLKSASINSE
ncbi:MAG: DMT family transporter [Patescibacteria group bacterium]